MNSVIVCCNEIVSRNKDVIFYMEGEKTYLTLNNILKMECCGFSPPSARGLNQKQLNWSSVIVNECVNHGHDS